MSNLHFNLHLHCLNLLNWFFYQIARDLEWALLLQARHKEKFSVFYLLQFVFQLTTWVVVHNNFLCYDRPNNFFKHLSIPAHQGALDKLNYHLAPLLLTKDWVSLNINCKPLSLIINAGTPLVAKNLFKTQTHDEEKQSGTKSRYIHLV